jgi:levansucrase
MEGRRTTDHPELLRSNFGGTPAPRFSLVFEGDRVTVR